MTGPLHGVRVLDLTTVVMGPYATQILADFGADVIKVESPDGDNMRWVWPFRNPGMGHIFLNANRNKRSVVLDLKKAPGRDACLAIAAKSDVLVYNIRPQAMARLRLSYEEVRKANPRIIYAGCFGYSQRGPYAAKAAYDDMIQGAAGLPWLLKKQGASEPRYAPMIVADRSVGQQVASAVSAAQRFHLYGQFGVLLRCKIRMAQLNKPRALREARLQAFKELFTGRSGTCDEQSIRQGQCRDNRAIGSGKLILRKYLRQNPLDGLPFPACSIAAKGYHSMDIQQDRLVSIIVDNSDQGRTLFDKDAKFLVQFPA
jgi:hypothetical protein